MSLLGDFDLKREMKLAFNKCPECSTPLISDGLIRWCAQRSCTGFSGPTHTPQQRDLLSPSDRAAIEQVMRVHDQMKERE